MRNIEKCRDRVYPCPDNGQPHLVPSSRSIDSELRTNCAKRGLSVQYLAVFLIKVYQNTLAFVFPQACRFYPSCSEYSVQALEKHGFFKGGWLSVRRILRCHPFNPGGYDPVE